MLALISSNAGTRAIRAGSGLRLGRPLMRPVLHVYDPSSSTELNIYLDGKRCELAVSFDEAPKLAHSIAIELDDALDSAMLTDGGDTVGLTVIISDAEDMEVAEACLSALGSPAGAAILPRNFGQDRDVGFCCNSETAELQAPRDCLQPILDATAVLADELDEHFEFSVSTRKEPGVVLYGGRAPDGCIIGVLGVR